MCDCRVHVFDDQGLLAADIRLSEALPEPDDQAEAVRDFVAHGVHRGGGGACPPYSIYPIEG